MAPRTATTTTPTPRRSSARTKEPRVPLSRDLIVDTACQLIRESHADQLTMRALAQRLGVALGATYYHVADRTELLTLVSGRINDSVHLRSTRPADWATTLRALMLDYAEVHSQYPGMASFANSHMEATGPAETQHELLRMLAEVGFSPRSAVDVLTAFFFYTSGATATDLLFRDQPGIPAVALMRRFDSGLDLLIEGARARLRADKRARRTVS